MTLHFLGWIPWCIFLQRDKNVNGIYHRRFRKGITTIICPDILHIPLSTLLQVMFGAKPWPIPMLTYCELDSLEQSSVFQSKHKSLSSRKFEMYCVKPSTFCSVFMVKIIKRFGGRKWIRHTGATLLVSQHHHLEPTPLFRAYSRRRYVWGWPQQHQSGATCWVTANAGLDRLARRTTMNSCCRDWAQPELGMVNSWIRGPAWLGRCQFMIQNVTMKVGITCSGCSKPTSMQLLPLPVLS